MNLPFAVRTTLVPRRHIPGSSGSRDRLGFYIVFSLSPRDSVEIRELNQTQDAEIPVDWATEWPSKVEGLFREDHPIEKRPVIVVTEIPRKGKAMDLLQSLCQPHPAGLQTPGHYGCRLETPPDCKEDKPNKFYSAAEAASFWKRLVAPVLSAGASPAPSRMAISKAAKDFDANPPSASDLRARDRIESPDRRKSQGFNQVLNLRRAMDAGESGWESEVQEHLINLVRAPDRVTSLLKAAGLEPDDHLKSLKDLAENKPAKLTLTPDQWSSIVRVMSRSALSKASTETTRVQRLIDSGRHGEKRKKDEDKTAGTPSLMELVGRLHHYPSLARQFRLTVWCTMEIPADWTQGKVGILRLSLPGLWWEHVGTQFEFQPPKGSEPGWFRPLDDGTMAKFDVNNLWRKYHLAPGEVWDVTQGDSLVGSSRASAFAGRAPQGEDEAAKVNGDQAAMPDTEGYSLFTTPADYIAGPNEPDNVKPISAAEALANKLKRDQNTNKLLIQIRRLRAKALRKDAKPDVLTSALKENDFKNVETDLENLLSPPKAWTDIREARKKLANVEFATDEASLKTRDQAARDLAAAQGKVAEIHVSAAPLMRGYTVEIGSIPGTFHPELQKESEVIEKIAAGPKLNWHSLCWRQVRIYLGKDSKDSFPPQKDKALIEEGYISASATAPRRQLAGHVKDYSAPDNGEQPTLGSLSLARITRDNVEESVLKLIVSPGRPGETLQSNKIAPGTEQDATVFSGSFRRLVLSSDVKKDDFVHIIESVDEGNQRVAREIRVFPIFESGDLAAIQETTDRLQLLLATAQSRPNEQFSLGILSSYSHFLDVLGQHHSLPVDDANKFYNQFITEADRRYFTLEPGDVVPPVSLPRPRVPPDPNDTELPIQCAELPSAVLHWIHLRPEIDRVERMDLPFVPPRGANAASVGSWVLASGTSLRLLRGITRGVSIEFKAKLNADPIKGGELSIHEMGQGAHPHVLPIIFTGEAPTKSLKDKYCQFTATLEYDPANPKAKRWVTSQVYDLVVPPNDTSPLPDNEKPEDVRGLDNAPIKHPRIHLEVPGQGLVRVEFDPVMVDPVAADATLKRFILPWLLVPGDFVEVIGGGSANVFRARAVPQHPFAFVYYGPKPDAQGLDTLDAIVFSDGSQAPRIHSDSAKGLKGTTVQGFWKMRVEASQPAAIKLEADALIEPHNRRILAEVISVEIVEARAVNARTGLREALARTGEIRVTLGSILGDFQWQLSVIATSKYLDIHPKTAPRGYGDLEPGDCVAFTATYDVDNGRLQVLKENPVNDSDFRCGLIGQLAAVVSRAEALVLGSDQYLPASVFTPRGRRRDINLYAESKVPVEGFAGVAATPIILVRNLIQETSVTVLAPGAAAPAATQQVMVSDNIVRWKGWSLVVEQPGNPDETREGTIDRTYRIEVTLPPQKETGGEPWELPLPPLRLGHLKLRESKHPEPWRYVFRVRRTDIAGNHGLDERIPADENTSALHVPPPYVRHEPPVAPLFARQLDDEPNQLLVAVPKVEGENATPVRLLIVTDPIKNPRANGNAEVIKKGGENPWGDRAVTNPDRAYLLPPPIAAEAATTAHGMLDDAKATYDVEPETLLAYHDRSMEAPEGADAEARQWYDGTLAYTNRRLSKPSKKMLHCWNYFPDPSVSSVLLILADFDLQELPGKRPLVHPLQFHLAKSAPPPLLWTPAALQLESLEGAAPVRSNPGITIDPQTHLIHGHTFGGQVATASLPAGRRCFAIVKQAGMIDPWMRIELVHAVTSPTLRPEWNPATAQSPERPELDTSQVVEGIVNVDVPSTGEMRVIAWWNQYWDEPSAEENLRPARLSVIHDATTILQDMIDIIEPGAGYGTDAIVRFEDASKTMPVEYTFSDADRPVLEPVFKEGRLQELRVRKGGVLKREQPLRLRILRRPPLSHFAYARATVGKDGSITQVDVAQAGGWYTNPPFVVFHDTTQGSDGFEAQAVAVLSNEGGIDHIEITNPGNGYSPNVTVGIYTNRLDLGTTAVPMPVRATANPKIEGGIITAVKLASGGGPYARPPAVQVCADKGGGAELLAELDREGRVTKVHVLSGGAGYPDNARIVFGMDFSQPHPFHFPMNLGFGDTRARTIYCEAYAFSRYEQTLRDTKKPHPLRPRISLPYGIRIRSSARPPKPEVSPFTHSYSWNLPAHKRRLEANVGATLEIKREAAIRVWLRRPWHVSGQERLGIVILNAEKNTNRINKDIEQIIPAKMRALVSRWGFDPVWDDTALPPLRIDDLTNSVGFIPYEDLRDFTDDNERMVGVSMHEVFYDDRTDQWYADVSIRRPTVGAPFVQLAVVRVQEHASAGCLLSEVHLCDMIALPADRQISITRSGPTTFDFQVTGAFESLGENPDTRKNFESEPMASRREIRVEFRRRAKNSPSFITGPLANDPNTPNITQRDDRFRSADIKVLKRQKAPDGRYEFNGSMQVRWPEQRGENCYFEVAEFEMHPTSEAHRSTTGETGVSTLPIEYGSWKPFTCAIECEAPSVFEPSPPATTAPKPPPPPLKG